MARDYKIITANAMQTKKLGKEISSVLGNIKSIKGACIIALTGNLGAGKTTFIQGFAKGMGLKEKILSPSFVIMKVFRLKKRNFKCIFHIDCYRIKKFQELVDLGFREIVESSENIVLIEWADRIKRNLPSNRVDIKFNYKGRDKREIEIKIPN